MSQNLRIIIIVVMRLASLHTLVTWLLSAALIVCTGPKREMFSSWGEFGLPLMVGFLLWLLARPCADLVTHGIDE